MFRKITSTILIIMFCFSTIVSAQANVEVPLMGKLSTVEKGLFGEVQSGAILERITKAEKLFYGQETSRTMVDKVDFLYDNLFVNVNGQAAAWTKANAIEWAIVHSVTAKPLKVRVESLENLIEGKQREGSIQERMLCLANLAFDGGEIRLKEQKIPADTLVKIKLMTSVDSKTANIGDKINYQVAEDVVVDGTVVVPKGAEGIGTVKKVSRSHNFGRDAKVEIDFDTTKAIDGTQIPTFLGEKAQKETETLAIAAGATIAGLAILGPVGIVTGVFVKGKEISIPEGTEMYIQTKTEVNVNGIQMQ